MRLNMEDGDKTFKRITNNDIYGEIIEVKKHLSGMNSSVKLHRKWLYGVSVVMMAILGWIMNGGIP